MSGEDVPRTLRTPEQPMAFTLDELLRGGLTVWLTFVALLAAAVVLFGAIPVLLSDGGLNGIGSFLGLMFIVVIIAGLVSGVVLVFAMILVGPLARALRRVSSVAMHVAVYTLLGAGIGVLYLTVITGGNPASVLNETLLASISAGGSLTLIFYAPALAATIAVPLGWWLTVRRVLRQDAASPGLRAARPAAPPAEEPIQP